MDINSVNYNLGASYGAYNQKLTQATKQKLEELGIPYNQGITEAEGQQLLQKFASYKSKNSTSNNNNQNETDLFRRAKQLAERLGIQATPEMNFEYLLQTIEDSIKSKIEANKNNLPILEQLKSLSSELSFIQAQSSGSLGLNSTNQTLMNSLEVLSEYNKNFLNR